MFRTWAVTTDWPAAGVTRSSGKASLRSWCWVWKNHLERGQQWRKPGDVTEQRSGQSMGTSPLGEPRKLVTKAKSIVEAWLHKVDCDDPDAALLKKTELAKMNETLDEAPS